MLNFKKLFLKAKEENLEPFEVTSKSALSLSISLFNDEVENLTSSTDGGIYARGLYKDQLGSFSSDKADNSEIDFIVNQVLENAKYGIKGEPELFLKPGLKYQRVHTYFKGLENITSELLVSLGQKIYKLAKELDSRIDVVQTSLEYSSTIETAQNSNGLKLKDKSNRLVITTSLQAKDGKEIQSGFNYAFVTDLNKLNYEEFTKEAVRKTVSQFNGIEVSSNKYNVLLNNESAAILLSILLDQTSAYSVKNHLSLFENKVGQQVLSKKLTILDAPHSKTLFDTSFDDDLYPTSNKVIVDKGVLKTYLYDLQTAKEFNTTTTGNGTSEGGKVVPAFNFMVIKKGRLSFEELVKKVNNGIYITSLEGIGTGINSQSGDYSLQASGYLIEDGKISKPIPLMTASGNLLKDFNKVEAVGSDSKLTYYGVNSPSIILRKISVSGK